MATTDQFQIKPDYYSSKQECISSIRKRVNTNPRYKFFNQTHFTAGDSDQFMKYKDPTNGQICIPDIPLDNNCFRDVDISEGIDWSKYSNIDALSVIHTFQYIFEKFKKGIFVKIKDGKLAVFLPFSKQNFTNEWSDKIHIDPKYGDIVGFIRHIHDLEGHRFFPRSVNKFVESWYGNNCLVRYEYPINEGDTNHTNISDMLRTLCATREVPDIEFFINRRDFPIIKKDGTEAYEDMFGSNQPLLSHNYTKYAPILSMVTRNNYADIPMPTGEDWARISSKENKFFPKACREYLEDFTPTPWNERKDTAVFRGGSTGCGVTVDTNIRLKLAYLSHTQPKNENLLDAGITNWNLRPRKLRTEKYLQTIDIKKMPFKLVNRLTPQEQTQYKYLINVDGHVSAFRLSLELGMGSCILLADSKYKMWYRKMLKPYVHYVPIKADLSNLYEQIRWCREHDDECRQIAIESKQFHDTYLMKNGVLDYMQKLLIDLKHKNGIYLYNEITPLDLQISEESKSISLNHPNVKEPTINHIPKMSRCNGLLKGVHWLVNLSLSKAGFPETATKGKMLFQNRMTTVNEYKMAGFSFAVKTTSTYEKVHELTHEVFVGIKCINKLCKHAPNFVYNFGMYKTDESVNVIMERVIGPTMSEYIQSKDFNIQDYIFILVQIALAIQVAQYRYGLVHYDLTPWNIIIQKLPRPVEFDYVIGIDKVYRIKTSLIPIILDFGKSHVIYNNTHYGDIHMFKTSTIQDILSILVTSIYECTETKLEKRNVKSLVTLANFMSGTKYRNRPFVVSGRDGAGDLRFFLRNAKKHTELISSNKYELEERNPMDFIKYVTSNFKVPVKIVQSYRYNLDKGNARQVFEFSISGSLKEKIESYTNVFTRVKKCKLPEIDNLLLIYYTIQTIRFNLDSVYDSMIRFLNDNNISPEPMISKYTDVIKHISSMYKETLKSRKLKKLQINIDDYSSLINAPYDQQTFIDPWKIFQLIKESDHDQSQMAIVTYRELIIQTLLYEGEYTMPDDVKQFYVKSCKPILDMNPLYAMNNVANNYTLKKIAREIYSLDYKSVLQKVNDEKGNCKTAKRYLDVYKQILF